MEQDKQQQSTSSDTGNNTEIDKEQKKRENKRQRSKERRKQKMANETPEQQNIRLAKRREAYKRKKDKRNEVVTAIRQHNTGNPDRDRRLAETGRRERDELEFQANIARENSETSAPTTHVLSEELRLERNRNYVNKFRAKETPENREKRLKIMKQNATCARQNETAEQKQQRLAVSQKNNRKSIENETAEQKRQRLTVIQQNNRKCIENETAEQNRQRLAVLKQNTRKRIENETAEQKRQRLAVLKQNTRKSIENETAEQRQRRLTALQVNTAQQRANETLQAQQQRLQSAREQVRLRRELQTIEETEERLEQARENSAVRREQNNILVAHHVDDRHEYLHNGVWENVDEPLHLQQWVINEMEKFHSGETKYQNKQCSVCKEAWPTKQGLTLENYMCLRCKRERKIPKTFSVENDMDPGVLPPELQGLTQVEEMLIARVCPIMRVYRKRGGQRGYKGHVLNLPQDIESFLDKLPARVENLPVLVVRRHGAENTHRDFTVRRQRVLDAILWLKAQNPYYRDIEIDQNAVDSLPENGVPQQIRFVDDDVANDNIDDENEGPPQEEQNVANELAEESVVDNGSTSFIPLRQRQRREADAIRAAVNEEDPLDWPTVEGNAVNEFRTDGLATMAFPTLFPYGKGDPTNRVRVREVSLAEGFRHLEKFAELLPNGKYRWRFASHPRFPYWALDMKQRHQLLSQANIYLTQHPGDANLTLEELKNMVNTMTCNQMVNRLQRYVSKVQGTNQYWYQRLQELLALIEQKGCPTFFFTFSAADSYWPNLQRLLQNEDNATRGEKTKSVIDNPHLTDWYFKQRLDDYIKHWLNGVLDAEWYWFRFEYQARGSIHAHGCAKLKNEPNLNRLRTKAGEGWLRQRPNRVDHLDEEGDFMFEGIIAEGREAERYLIRYANWLVTTVNNDMPDGEWRFPEVHPSSIKPCDVENKDEDYQRRARRNQWEKILSVLTIFTHTWANLKYSMKSI